MGFRLEASYANLDFSDTILDGAHVKTRLDIKLDVVLNLQALAESEKSSDIRRAFEQFGEEVLVEWDLETDKGISIPTGKEGMLNLDIVTAQFIMQAWMSAITQVPSPLGSKSSDGNGSQVQSTGKENLFRSLENLSTPNS